MKKTLFPVLTLALMLMLAACGTDAEQSNTGSDDSTPGTDIPVFSISEPTPADQPDNTTLPEAEIPEDTDSGKPEILIAYFSATNNTENIANHLNDILTADLYEIVPETPYTSEDLNYNDSSSRSSRETNDPDTRPAISGSVDNMEQYDIIFMGYPIWWGEAPRIINTFLESYDFSGKAIAPFCTSASSPMGSSAANLQELTDGVTWLEGRRFSGSASASDVQSWVDSLDWNG